MEFLCGALRPIIDGKIKPDQLRLLLDAEIGQMETEHHAPVSVLQKTGDAMPGFGIVAAVLGIVITMASIGGAVEDIGTHVAAALVGTFLGILMAYGFMGPLATNMEFIGESELDFTRCIAACVTGFANGMAPVTAVELGRRGLSSEYPSLAGRAGTNVQVHEVRKIVFNMAKKKHGGITAVRGKSPTRISSPR